MNKTNETQEETGMIQLEELVFPGEYFCGIDDGTGMPAARCDQPEPVLTIQIDDPKLEKLKKIAIWLEVELPELLLGAYLYLLGEISEQPSVVVQTMLSNNGQVFPLRAELHQRADLIELFRVVKHKCAEPSKPGRYSLTQFSNMRLEKGQYKIIPFFAWDSTPAKVAVAQQTMTQHAFAQYDLRFYLQRVPEARTRAGRVSFSFGFNRQILRQDMVEKFIQTYLHLLDTIIEKMEFGGLLR